MLYSRAMIEESEAKEYVKKYQSTQNQIVEKKEQLN